MSRFGDIDIRQLKSFSKLLNNTVNPETLDKMCRKETKNIAARLIRKAKKRTPVGQYQFRSGRSGGTLRRGWSNTELTKQNGAYLITVFNPVEYASYVEFGHRNRSHTGWIEGRFMMTNAEREVNEQAPKFLDKALSSLLRGASNDK